MSAKTPEWAVQIQQKLSQLDTKLDHLLDQLQQLTTARAQPAPTHPTFCGYPCSWDINDAGWPTCIHLEDGTRALHREKQGDHWYSVALGDGQYGEHYLKIRRPSPLKAPSSYRRRHPTPPRTPPPATSPSHAPPP